MSNERYEEPRARLEDTAEFLRAGQQPAEPEKDPRALVTLRLAHMTLSELAAFALLCEHIGNGDLGGRCAAEPWYPKVAPFFQDGKQQPGNAAALQQPLLAELVMQHAMEQVASALCIIPPRDLITLTVMSAAGRFAEFHARYEKQPWFAKVRKLLETNDSMSPGVAVLVSRYTTSVCR